MAATERPGYRPDIDGLRALAVLPVVLYHAGVPGISGGYVGVDIFFVISGFLITGIIAREIDDSRFSIWAFYERRARRILPALFAVLAFVLAAASLLFLPGDFEAVPKSALAALLFVANIWFFTQSGYFQSSAETIPLLHTWSLGLEEQYYIVFPLALILIARIASRWRVILVWAGAAASLALAIATQNAGDGSAFYLLPARAWELLTGSLLALGAITPVRSRPVREVMSWAGIAAILFAVLTYDKQTVFPGLAALPPVIGSALLIHCAPGTAAGRVLAWRPAVWIGLISYSLYLWHWPLIVFARYAQDAPLSAVQSALVVVASILVAWASLKWIETPFRNRKRYSRKAIFAISAAGIATLCGVSLAMVAQGPWASRFPAEAGQITRMAASDVSPVRETCLVTANAAPDSACTLGAAASPDAMIWGDSHAVEFAWVLGERAKAQGRAIAERSMGSCPPAIGYQSTASPHCAAFNQRVLQEIESHPEIRTVWLAAFWESEAYASPETAKALDAAINRLQAMGRKVMLIGPVPSQHFEVPRTLARASAYGMALPQGSSIAEYRRKTQWIAGHLPGWRKRGVTIIEPAPALFDGNHSRILVNGHPLYFDSHHLTLTGARLVLDSQSTRK